MINLKSISKDDISFLDGFSYGNMPKEKKEEMISHSQARNHNGKYFEFFLIEYQNQVVGVLNVVAHSQSVVSVAPEIKSDFRRKGLAKKALEKVFENLKRLNYKIVYAGIREDNLASVNLHYSLGFEYVQDFLSSKGNKLKMFIKLL